jgi:hypothetical protein
VITVYSHSATTGAYVSTISTRTISNTSTYYYIASGSFGIALIGTEVWVGLYKYKFDTSWTYYSLVISVQNGTEKTLKSFTTDDYYMGHPIISVQSATSTQMVVQYSTSATAAYTTIALYNPSTGTFSSSWTTAPNEGMAVGVKTSVYYGNMDFGDTRYVVGSTSQDSIRSYTIAGVEQTGEAWPRNQSPHFIGYGTINGITGPWTCTSTGNITFYDGPKYAVGSEPVFSQTLYDSNSTGGYHETAESPLSGTSLPKKRARLLVTATPLVTTSGTDGVSALRIYAGSGSGTRYLVYTGTGNTVTLSAIPTSGTTPGSVPVFPSSTPGIIQSADGSTLVIKADGTVIAGAITGRSITGSIDASSIKTGTIDSARLPTTWR